MATISVVALTIYFLIALPGVKKLWLSLIPRSRRDRAELLTDEVFGRVGGFMLGNLFTSVISGLGTYIWLLIFGVPYTLLLALVVALFDLIPLVGSTIAGIIVSLVALTKGIPVGIATAGFYVVYRYLEDYLLNPRVMKHTVKVTPGLTIIATLIGGTLLGLIGALIAIPVAATIHPCSKRSPFPDRISADQRTRKAGTTRSPSRATQDAGSNARRFASFGPNRPRRGGAHRMTRAPLPGWSNAPGLPRAPCTVSSRAIGTVGRCHGAPGRTEGPSRALAVRSPAIADGEAARQDPAPSSATHRRRVRARPGLGRR